MSPNIMPIQRKTADIVVVVCTSKGGRQGVFGRKCSLDRPPAAPPAFKIRKLPPVFFFVVGIASTCRNKCKFSLHNINFCWAGNAYFSTQKVFTTTFFPPKKKNTNFPDFGMNFGTQNTQGPLVLLLSMMIGVTKIVEQCSNFIYGPWFKRYAKKSKGGRAAPTRPPPSARWRVKIFFSGAC